MTGIEKWPLVIERELNVFTMFIVHVAIQKHLGHLVSTGRGRESGLILVD